MAANESALDLRGDARFEILSRLGAGGRGVVYEALDRQRGERVAIKTLRRLGGESLYRFKREFRGLQNIEHPNLVSLGELIERDGQWFYTMELVEGVGLLEYVRPGIDAETGDEGSLDVERLRDALAQLAVGVTALHGAGRIHRDIKPNNVRVTRDARVVLLDFGLICDVPTADEGEADTELHGTAAYMAPEQAASRPIGPEADWYSVGVVLYESLTGRQPFRGSVIEILADKQVREPELPADLESQVPLDLGELCIDLLRLDPALRPTSEAILRRLGVVDKGSSSHVASSWLTQSAPFLGREAELARLRTAFDESCGNHAVVVNLVGESGIGKSRLIRELIAQVRVGDERAVLLSGHCYERETVPFKAFDGLADSLASYLRAQSEARVRELLPDGVGLLARLFPVFGRVEFFSRTEPEVELSGDVQQQRLRSFRALRALLGRIARSRQLVLVIEDMQWADADSLHLLREVLREPEAPPLLLLVSTRGDDPGADWLVGREGERWAITGDMRELRLGPLVVEAAEELARLLLVREQVRGDVDPSSIAREARGHPLYIDELVRHAALVDGEEPARPLLDEVILLRASRLPGEAQRILEMVAVAGAPMSQGAIRAAVRAKPAVFARLVTVLRVANLVCSGGARGSDPIDTFHDRVREAVVGALDEGGALVCHDRLAIVLQTTDAAIDRPGLLLRHLEAAGKIDRAAEYAERAASSAARVLAFDRAANLYELALRVGTYDEAARCTLLVSLAEALANAGRGPESGEAFLDAAEVAEAAMRLQCQRRAAEQFLLSGHVERGFAALGHLLGLIGLSLPRSPKRALLSLYWHRAKLRLRGLGWKERQEREIAATDLTRLDVYHAVAHGLGVVDVVRSADFQARGLLLALRLGERTRVGMALAAEAAMVAQQSTRSRKRARRLVAQVDKLAADSGPLIGAYATWAEGFVSYFEGRFAHAAAILSRAEIAFREQTTGRFWELSSVRLVRLFALRNMGAFDQLRGLFAEHASDARRRGDRYAETTLRRLCCIVHLLDDAPDDAEQELQRAFWAPPEGGFHVQHWFDLRARGEIALYRGRAPSFLAKTLDDFAALEHSLLTRVQTMRAEEWWLRGRVLLAAHDASGGAASRRSEVADLARRLAGEGVPYATVWSRMLSASLAERMREKDHAVGLLQLAETAAGAQDMSSCMFAVRRRRGELIGGDAGDAMVADADAWADSQGIASPHRVARMLLP